jgi:predicted AAA+ superfamily ATPase
VNNFYSGDEMYYPRWLTPLLREASAAYPVVVLTGARQVGKSTLLRRATPFCDWRYHTLDDFDTASQAARDPAALWAGAEQVILDEVQKAPQLLPAVKTAVDQEPGRRRFILSGSANLMLMHQVSESLAGRAVYLTLSPMTLGELQQTPPPEVLQKALGGEWPLESVLPGESPDPTEVLLRGLLPTLLRFPSPQSWTRWWDGYVATYLERDLRQLSQVSNLIDFRRAMMALALRTGQLLNQSDVARDAGLSQATLHRYLNLLEITCLFERLPIYAGNRTSRLVKAPKVFWADPGLAVFLAGYFTAEAVRGAREYGAFFETLIYHHLRVLAGLMTPPGRLYYWRTQTGAEADFVLEHGRRCLAIEVKRAERPRYDDCAGLVRFLAENPQAAGGLLLHGGREIRRLGEKIVALPWTMVTA